MKKRLAAFLSLIMCFSVLSGAISIYSVGETPGWYGTPASESVYIISSEEELVQFAALVSAGETFSGKTVLLTESVALAKEVRAEGVFMGVFSGLGNTVTLSASSRSGLFAKLDGASVTDLSVIAPEGTKLLVDKAGGVIADEAVNCLFDGVTLDGKPGFAKADEDDEGDLLAGMIAGSAENSVFMNCTVTAESTFRAGVLAGIATRCDVCNCFLITDLVFLESEECGIVNSVARITASGSGSEGSETTAPATEAPETTALATEGPETTAPATEGPETTATTTEAPATTAPATAAPSTDAQLDRGAHPEPVVSPAAEFPETGVPDAETPGIIRLDKTDMSAAEIAGLLNKACASNSDYNLWSVSDGEPVLHAHLGIRNDSASSCTVHGMTSYICDCGRALISFELPLSPHTLSAAEVVAPNCTEQGYTVYRCTVCGEYEEKGDYVEALGHTTVTQGAYDPTCVSKGYTGDKVCTVCGTVVKKGSTIKATGEHNWVGVITREATADEQGLITLTCAVCGKTSTEVIPKLGHTLGSFANFDETYHRALCSCGKEEDTVYEEHNWSEGRVVKNPTCAENGQIHYSCLTCGRQKDVEIPMLGHSYGAWTNSDDSFHTSKCPTCGDIRQEEHKFSDGTVVSENEEGDELVKQILYKCSVCSAQVVKEERSAVVRTGTNSGVAEPRDNDGNDVNIGNDPTVKYIIIAAIALLMIGGVIATVYVKRSDRA